jgi:hypothetical protein
MLVFGTIDQVCGLKRKTKIKAEFAKCVSPETNQIPAAPGYRVLKLLSVDPANYPDAPREGIRRILEEVRFPSKKRRGVNL